MQRLTCWAITSALSLAALSLGCESADDADDDSPAMGGSSAGASGAGKGGGSSGASSGGGGGKGGSGGAGGSGGGSAGAATGGASGSTSGSAGQGAAGSGGEGAEAGSTGAGGNAGSGTGGASGAGGGDSGAGGGGGSGASTSTGCNSPAPIDAPQNLTITVDGQERSYHLVPPTDYDSSQPYPVVFGFHGSGGNGEGLRGFLGLETAAGGQAIFVYPDGLGGIWDLGNSGADVQMLDAVLASVEETFCVDQNAVFATGFSYGGWMATQAACARPDVFTGIASIAGGGPQGGGCSAPVAAMIIHGSADDAEPIVAGENSRDHFVDTNGCDSTSAPADPVPCVAYAGCEAQKDVLWCEYDGGHGVPEFAGAGMWSFFASVRP